MILTIRMPLAAARSRQQLAGLATMAALVLLAVIAMPSRTAPSHPRGPRAASAPANVPLAALGPVSAALGADQPAYRVTRDGARNRPQSLHATFAPEGITISSGVLRVRLRLAGFGRSRALHPVGTIAPVATGNRVEYARHEIEEWWTNGPLGLEQGFDVRARPVGADGPLTVALAVSGTASARLAGGAVSFNDRRGHVLRYGRLSASDARGRLLPASLALDAGRLLIHVDDRGAEYPVRIDPFVQQAELSLADGAGGDAAAAVAIDGDTLVVGAPGRTLTGNARQGAVYVFVKPASGWAHATPVAQLTASDGAASDELGNAVAISGNTIAAAAPGHKVGGAKLGAAYVFVEPTAGWSDGTQIAELTASDANPGDGFPASVAIDGDTVVAGPVQHQVANNPGQGEAYVFTSATSGWQNGHSSTILRAMDGAAGDNLGRSVAISGDTILAGAPNRKVANNPDQGAVYVFDKPQGMTVLEYQKAKLTATDGAAGDNLGTSVAISPEAAVAGAPNHQVGLTHQGAAYVFARTLTGFRADTTQTAELTASDGVANDGFGNTIAASGDNVLVGAYSHQDGPNQFEGAAYVFTRPGFVWRTMTETAELTPMDGVTLDLFGISLAISGNELAVGGGLHPIGDSRVGKGGAYVFAIPPSISIDSPAQAARVTQGTHLNAAFSCAAPEGATVVSCTGSVPIGTALDTSSLGTHTFTVQALDSDGATATSSASYTVVAPRPPLITAVRQSSTVWRLSAKHAGTPTRVPIGTTFSFRLEQPATVQLRFTRVAKPHKAQPRCAAAEPLSHCVRTTAAGTLRLIAHPGANSVRFEGRLSRTRWLTPGDYLMQITAINATGQRASAAPLRFRIVS